MKHHTSEVRTGRASALRPVAVYAAFSCLWILFSDQLALWLFRNPWVLPR